MKRFFIFLFIPFFSQLTAQDYTLNINSGTVVGDLFYGDTVHVFSDKATAASVFSNWSGNGVDYLALTDEWHTTLVVPEQSGLSTLNLQANFEALSANAEQTTEMIELFGEDNGVFVEQVLKEVHYSIPENPKGIVFLFHGSGGAGENMYSKYEVFTLIKDLYFAGYGSIATDANERTIGDQNGDGIVRWIANQGAQQTLDNNIDLYNIAALKDTFISRYNLAENFPFFSYGVSNGANFSDISAAVIGFRASAHNVGNGSPSLYNLHPNATPVIWLQSVNDQNSNANPVLAQSNYQALQNRGICTEWHWLEPSPLYGGRFTRSRNSINLQKSIEIYDHLNNFPDLVDEKGFITVEDVISTLPNSFFTSLGLTNAQINDVKSQLKVANADHVGHGDFNKTIIRFFENNCVTTEVEKASDTAINLSVFPNPTYGNFQIDLPLDQLADVYLMDVSGQVILEKKGINSSTEFNITHLAAGCYFITIQLDNNLINQQVILLK